MNNIEESLRRGDALLIVDVQKDFCPGGALPIQDGDKVVPILNRWIAAAVVKSLPIYASRDWHPVGHISFKERCGPWPPHCIQDSDGAGFHANLKLPKSVVKVTKGTRFDRDQNSVFDETGLAEDLRKKGIKRLLVGGLAEDVCVLATVLDGCREGFEVTLISDGTRPISVPGSEKARKKMLQSGVHFVTTN
ncbi:MAG: isochorismatase family protein [Xenococcaceae cyanobacterium MO_167.B52]|nr:isochorismatase family protein [Xenococcaceae cyanobacterium MO_167.B52]